MGRPAREPRPGGAAATLRQGPARDDALFFAASALLFLASVAGVVHWCAPMSGGMSMPGGWTLSMTWMKEPGRSWPGSGASFVGVWVVMMIGMMLPSLVATLRRRRRGEGSARGAGVRALLSGAGYFVVWAGLGAVVYPIGVVAATVAMRSSPLARAVPAAAGAVLLVAGSVQLSAWKLRRLAVCRADAGCALGAADARGAWRDGVNLGIHCTLCCCGLMAVLLVLGAMDLRAMAGVSAAITAERLLGRPALVARGTGVVVIGGAVLVIARALVGGS